ncbi:MAG: methylenetetrahydrofolate reductase [NAD(P)H] [Spirochaetes bacterium RBG_16_49_21]|nr:MAG: methylenetetrahydrofolate reductase [NAD(P)H] [Spirochaetes bacterium RBG_16_49_21]
MNIDSLYNERFVISFEIFPPKTEAGEESLMQALKELSAYKPGFISVTYGAGGSTREKTLELSLKIRDRIGITPVVHFTCVGSGRREIAEYLRMVKAKRISNILALRGDPPQGQERFVPPPDGFSYANELVTYIREIEVFNIGVAGYPEGHIEAPDLDTDIANLKKKVDAGASYIITQLFFSNNDFYIFMDKIRRIGITIPVIPGIMPITNMAQVKKVTTMCGAKIPPELMSRLLSCDSKDEICEVGIEYSIAQCRELMQWGIPGFHFYTMNKSTAVKKIIDALSL